MRRPLLKLYIIIILALAASIVLLPGIVGKTSAWAAVTVTHADLALYNNRTHDTASAADGARIAIVMDDGWETQYTQAYKLLSEHGMKANIAVVPSLVDMPGYMTYQQLAEVYMAGWDLLNHTVDHIDLTRLNEDEQIRQITEARAWLYEHQFYSGADIVVYPNGAYNDITISALEQNNVIAARSLRSVWDAKLGCTREDIEICNLISNMTFSEITAAIDKAAANDSALILMLHKIEPVTDDTKMQFDAQDFLRVIEYLDDNSDRLSVMTMTQLLAEE